MKRIGGAKKAAGAQVWKFKNGTTVWLAEGIVQKIAGPTVGNFVRRAGSTVWIPSPARKVPVSAAPVAVPSESGSRPADDIRKVAYFALFGGFAVFAMTNLRSWMILFKDGGAWLLNRAFVPLVSLVWSALARVRSRNDRAWRYR